MELAAAAPLNGEVMIGVGTPVVNSYEDLVRPRIVVHRPEGVRHDNGGGCHRESQNTRRDSNAAPSPSDCAHARTDSLIGPDFLPSALAWCSDRTA